MPLVDDYTDREDAELPALPEEALRRFDDLTRAMVSLETQIAELATSRVLGSAHAVRSAMHDLASDLAEKRHRIRHAVVKEQRRRAQGGDTGR